MGNRRRGRLAAIIGLWGDLLLWHQGGIGSDSLSEFFHLLHLEARIGVSASALRALAVQVKTQIIAYGQAQSVAVQGNAPIGICVGGDETFYGLPILVAVELASGFIFSEAECANRTDETWWEQVSRWFNREQWDCRMMVSDGAKALVKLALRIRSELTDRIVDSVCGCIS